MPNDSSVFQLLCDRLGVEEKHRSRLFWASIVGIPVVWWAFGARSQPQQKPDTSINAFFKDKSLKSAAVKQPSNHRQATNFDSFLKKPPQPKREATSFSSFLKTPQPHSKKEADSPSQQVVSGPEANDVIVTVLFGTEYGFSKEVAEKAAAAISACGAFW